MWVFQATVLSVFVLLMSCPAQSQPCANKISSETLASIPGGVNRVLFRGGHKMASADLVLSKEGEGPALFPVTESSEHSPKGIWIGKNNTWVDYSDIALTFSESLTSISFIITSINNDNAGREEVQDFRIKNADGEDVTSSATFKWIKGKASGFPLSDPGATFFNQDTRTIEALPGYCCAAASGCISITSTQPFSHLSFRHQEFGILFSKSNGIVLSGDLKFCVYEVKEPNQEIPTEKKNKPLILPKEKKQTKIAAAPEKKETVSVPVFFEQAAILENVFFEQGKATLMESSYTELDRLAEWMNKNPEMQIELYGHTDNQGLQELNKILSEQRVDVVKQYLVNKGISESRISGIGFGGLKPLVPNDTEENRKKNRRVEVKISTRLESPKG